MARSLGRQTLMCWIILFGATYIKALVEHKRDSTEEEVREEILAAFNNITPNHSGPVDPKKWPKVEFKIYFKQYFICHKNISENI